MWGDHWWNPLLPATVDSPPSGECLSRPPLSSGSAVAEKGGLEVASWGPSIKVGLHAFNYDQSRTFKNFLTGGPQGPNLMAHYVGPLATFFPASGTGG